MHLYNQNLESIRDFSEVWWHWAMLSLSKVRPLRGHEDTRMAGKPQDGVNECLIREVSNEITGTTWRNNRRRRQGFLKLFLLFSVLCSPILEPDLERNVCYIRRINLHFQQTNTKKIQSPKFFTWRIFLATFRSGLETSKCPPGCAMGEI